MSQLLNTEYLSQQLTAGQNEPPLNILQTHNLSTMVQKAAEHESTCKKNAAKKHANTCATNNMQRTQHARRPHTNKTLQCTQ